MGQDKLLLPWRGKSIIEHVLAAWRSSRVDHVIMVVRPGDERLAELGRKAEVDVVLPAIPPAEMRESVSIALRHIRGVYQPRPTDAWLVAPADLPQLHSEVIDRVLAAYDAERPATLVAATGGRRGHPVLFPWSRAAEVEGLAAGHGINSLTLSGVEVDVEDPRIHHDLDTPADFRRLDEEVDRC